MTDIHTHILPNFDDGAKDITESENLLTLLVSQGVGNVVLTPHYYSHEESIKDFLIRFNVAKQSISSLTEKYNIYFGAEVYLTKFLFTQPSIERLCLGNSNKILVEFPYFEFNHEEYYGYIQKLLDKKLVPILVHIERYEKIAKNNKIIELLKSEGCKFQINASSFFEKNLLKLITKLIETDAVDFIASDCHNIETRPPRLADVFDYIDRKYGADYKNKLIQNSDELLKEFA